MSIRSSFAEFAGRSSYWFLHTFMHGGSSLPGKLTLKLDPNILQSFSKKYDLVIVTGTNGKTLTTALSVRVLREKYDQVLTNPTGSNMEQGIVTTFITAPRAKKKGLAVLEVDEANVPIVCRYITPKAFVFTNIFRDQMDRYGKSTRPTTRSSVGSSWHQRPRSLPTGTNSSSTVRTCRILSSIMGSTMNTTKPSTRQPTPMACSAQSVSTSCNTTCGPTLAWGTTSAPTAASSGPN